MKLSNASGREQASVILIATPSGQPVLLDKGCGILFWANGYRMAVLLALGSSVAGP